MISMNRTISIKYELKRTQKVIFWDSCRYSVF